jgi:hypothetical protein
MSAKLLEHAIMVDFGDSRPLERVLLDYGLPTTVALDVPETTQTTI